MVKTLRLSLGPGQHQAAFTACCLLAVLTLLLRPYDGIRHDSILYFGQALNAIQPEELGRDLFFAYGSQSKFTLFPELLGFWLESFEPSVVSKVGLLLAFAIFVGSSGFFAAVSVPRRFVLYSLLVLLVWPSGYGGFGVFRFQEPYLTGRSFAEPLVVVALALMLQGRHWGAWVPLILAMLIHPLQALPGAVVWWALQVHRDKRWLALFIVATALGIILGVADLLPIRTLLSRYDREWLEVISEPNKHVFMLQWNLTSWASLLVDYFLVIAAIPFLAARGRLYAVALLFTSTLCFGLSILLADILQFVWATGVQAWRIHWILHWSALVFVPVAATHLWNAGRRTELMLFGGTLLMAAPYGPFASVYAALITVPLYFLWPSIYKKVGQPYIKVLHYALAFAVIVTYLRYLLYLLGFNRMGDFAPEWSRLVLGLSHPVALVPLIGVGVWLWMKVKVARLIIAALMMFALVASFSAWDQRSHARKLIEATMQSSDVFGKRVEPGATVFWHGDLLAPWMLLRRPSYWSDLQQAGLLFNRGTAMEAQRRAVLLQPFLVQAELCQLMDNLNKKVGSCDIDVAVFHDVCRDSHARLDYLILPFTLPIPKLGRTFLDDGVQWNSGSKKTGADYYLYSCKDMP